jgi:hypothetical protein
MIRNGHKKGAGLFGDGGGENVGDKEEKRKKEKKPAHTA